jgi:hypothetical protein
VILFGPGPSLFGGVATAMPPTVLGGLAAAGVALAGEEFAAVFNNDRWGGSGKPKAAAR